MAENKSDVSKHQSSYGGGFITSAQFLSELICENIAKKKKKKLSDRFWQDPLWKKDYGWQIVCANRLLKTYHPSILIKVLKDPQVSYKIISLGAISQIKPLLDQLQAKYEADLQKIKEKVDENKEINENPAKFTDTGPQKQFVDKKTKGNILNKLRGL